VLQDFDLRAQSFRLAKSTDATHRKLTCGPSVVAHSASTRSIEDSPSAHVQLHTLTKSRTVETPG